MSALKGLRRAMVAFAASWLAASAAQAAWLGLGDGDYLITLQCELSAVLPCPSTLSGTLSIEAGAADALDLSINGQHFDGNPFDGLDGNATVSFQSSGLSKSPFSFVMLAFITDGSFGPYGVGDRFWQYCVNTGPGVCSVSTRGSWSAVPEGSVPAPAPVALLAGGLVLLAGLRRTPRRSARHPGMPV